MDPALGQIIPVPKCIFKLLWTEQALFITSKPLTD